MNGKINILIIKYRFDTNQNRITKIDTHPSSANCQKPCLETGKYLKGSRYFSGSDPPNIISLPPLTDTDFSNLNSRKLQLIENAIMYVWKIPV